MEISVSTDPSVNNLFESVRVALMENFSHSGMGSISLIKEYYGKFQDPDYCRAIGVPTQDIDFFFHESALGMALRIQYYLVVKGDPDPGSYLDWRRDFFLRQSREG